MYLILSLLCIAVVIALLIRVFPNASKVWITSGQSTQQKSTVMCPTCHTQMNRQQHGQTCSKCGTSF